MRRPLITANQVTILRVLLLPIPCAMLLYGPRSWDVAAMIAYTLIGLTDWLDGHLARRHGPTVLGGLLDPVADKVFMTAVLVPLVGLGLCSRWVMIAITLREFLITSLRSALSLRETSMMTRALAKIKTSVQMAGSGVVFLIARVPGDGEIVAVLGAAAAITATIVLWRYVVTRRVNPLSLVACSLVALALVVRWALPPNHAISACWAVILVFTGASGAEYVCGALPIVGRVDAWLWQDVARLMWSVVAGAVVPMLVVRMPGAAPVLILLIATELTAGALDNLCCHERKLPGRWTFVLRSASLLLGSAVVALLAVDDRASLVACTTLAVVMAIGTLKGFHDARAIVWSPDRARAAS